jgi:hypothetical protein
VFGPRLTRGEPLLGVDLMPQRVLLVEIRRWVSSFSVVHLACLTVLGVAQMYWGRARRMRQMQNSRHRVHSTSARRRSSGELEPWNFSFESCQKHSSLPHWHVFEAYT